MRSSEGCRLLLVDDNLSIHADFRKVLAAQARTNSLSELEQQLFGENPANDHEPETFESTFAESGQEACRLAEHALLSGRPFEIAIVDMRMPGWDGLQTAQELLRLHPELEVAFTSAYMDYSWNDVIQRLQRPGLRLIPKPWTSGRLLGVLHELRARVEQRAAAGASPRKP